MNTTNTQTKSLRHKNMILLILGLAQLMDVLDTSIVYVAIPTISKDLHITGFNNLQWLVTAYGLTFAGFLFLAGKLADYIGHRRVFLASVFLFGLSSLMAGLSSSSGMLILWRGLQGLGAAGITAAALSSIISVYEEGKARNRAMTIWGSLLAVGVSLGFIFGGIITQYINWRWIFFVNVPISIIVLLAAPFFIPKLEGTGKLLLKKFDILGTLLLTSGLITLVFGGTKVPSYGWGNKDVVEALIIAMLLLIVFVFNELKVSEPLLNIGLLTKGNIAAVSVISMFVVGCNGAVFYFLSYYNQEVLQYSPLIVALTLLPVVLLALVALQPVRKLLDKFGFKPVIIGQLLILAIGLCSLVRLPVSGHYLSDELPSLIIIGLGITASIGLTIAATSGVKKEESGAISGVLNTAQQVGGPLILGILSTIAATHTTVSSTANTTVHGVHAAFVASAIFVLIAAMLCGVFVKGQSVTQKG